MSPFPSPRNSTAFSNQPGFIGTIARFWARTYAADYIALGLVATGFILIQLFVTPFHRMFYVDNLAIQFPFAKSERVPMPWSIVYSAVVPSLFLLLWTFLATPSAHKIHVTYLGLASTLIVTPFLTDLIKNAVGRPRPDLIDRCQPEAGTPGHKLVTFSVCTQANEHILQEGWRSFPSGHSSFAFAGLGFLSLFLAGQMHVFRPRADLGRCLIAILPSLGALMIAISRCEDYRHDVWDVTAGAVLGSSVAYFSYRRYYPSLRNRYCHIPYDLTDNKETEGFAQLPDDEERILNASDRMHGLEEPDLPIPMDSRV